ncbi:MAG: hypothetical protein FWH48_03875 [Oscillospiraceae bacterium]|nr:hypothetical protein [Oscillospiraceae bacterium]
MKKLSKIVAFLFVAAMLSGIFNIVAMAADPIVIDFSKYDYADDILDGAGGQGEYDMVNDGERRVLYAECVDGYVPEDDPEGTGTIGDLYGSIFDFESFDMDGDVYQWMKIGVKNDSAAPFFEFHFSSPTKDYNVETSVNLEINPNSDYTSYVYNVTEQCERYYPKRPADVGDPNVYPDHWHGLINKLRIDFMYYEESGGHARTDDKLYIEYIAFFDSKEAADAYVFTPARTVAQYEEAKAAADAQKAAEAAEKAEADAAKAAEAAAAAENAADDAANDANENEGVDVGDGEATEAASSAADSEDSGNNMMIIIIIVAAAVVVVVVIIVVVVVGKGKKKDEK